MTKIDLRKKVRIHEELAEALSTMSIREIDFETLFFLLAKISKSHTDETVYNLSKVDFEALTGSEQNTTYYTNSFKRLRSITLEIETDKSILIDGLVSSAEANERHGDCTGKNKPKNEALFAQPNPRLHRTPTIFDNPFTLQKLQAVLPLLLPTSPQKWGIQNRNRVRND